MAAASAYDGRGGGGEEESVVGESRDVKPIFVEIGIVVALSFVGFLGSQLRLRPRSRRRTLRPPSLGTLSPVSQTGLKDIGGGLRDELRVLKNEMASVEIVNDASITSDSTGDKQEFLATELSDSSMNDLEVSSKPRVKVETDMEQERASLRELVLSLKKREKTLDLHLLDYHGTKEQDAAVRELENRLKISATEAKLYKLKMESLKAENRMLQAQLVDYSRILNEQRAKVESLEMKLKSNREQGKVLLASLHERIRSLQCREHKDVETLQELETKLKRLEELESKAVKLRTVNLRLVEENSDLRRKLESSKMSKSPVLDDTKLDSLEEAQHMRQMNEKLREEIEQLQIDRCGDVEELVYLRWVNACLRYELRNYHPSASKTVARDLNKSLSLKSEEKAKQLILEYANSSICDESFEVDSEHSSSEEPNGEPGDTSYDDAPSSTRQSASDNLKLLSKFKKLVLGKGKQRNKILAHDSTLTSYRPSERRASVSACSISDEIGRDSYDSLPSRVKEYDEDVCSVINARPSLKIQALQRLHVEDTNETKGTPDWINSVIADEEKKISSLEDVIIKNNLINQENAFFPEKAEIKRLADALRSRRQMMSKSED